jgi:hypothetical protein
MPFQRSRVTCIEVKPDLYSGHAKYREGGVKYDAPIYLDICQFYGSKNRIQVIADDLYTAHAVS